MKKVLCFGELLLRFSPHAAGLDFNDSSMPVFIGGAELNVAHALAKWGIPTAYCTAMPQNFMSDYVLEYLQKKNIDPAPIHFSGERLGIYYLVQGADVKNQGVIFDRAHSSFAALQPGMINWKTVLKDVQWFHFSAIAASLTKNAADVCLEALRIASEMNISISVDLNYREKLWRYGYEPSAIMPQLVQFCDVIMGNMWSVEKLLAIASPIVSSEGKTIEELGAASNESIAALRMQFPKAKTIAYTLRLGEYYSAIWNNGEESFYSKKHAISNAVDRVGSGDCFMGGVIYAILNNLDGQDAISFCAAAAVNKLFEKGDVTNKTIEEVRQLI